MLKKCHLFREDVRHVPNLSFRAGKHLLFKNIATVPNANMNALEVSVAVVSVEFDAKRWTAAVSDVKKNYVKIFAVVTNAVFVEIIASVPWVLGGQQVPKDQTALEVRREHRA
jgi:hypothetical protein